MDREEREHVALIKSMACSCCELGPAPLDQNEAHEIEQGLWFTSIPVCPDCHRGSRNGLHGDRRMWAVFKKTELSALNDTIRKLMRHRNP